MAHQLPSKQSRVLFKEHPTHRNKIIHVITLKEKVDDGYFVASEEYLEGKRENSVERMVYLRHYIGYRTANSLEDFNSIITTENLKVEY